MKVLIVALSLSVLVINQAGAEWFVPLTQKQKQLEAGYVFMTVLDWLQTKQFRREGSREMNPGLGPEPSQERVDTMISAAIIGHIVGAYAIPEEYKDYWIIGFLIIETIAVVHNYSNGWGPGVSAKTKVTFSYEIKFK